MGGGDRQGVARNTGRGAAMDYDERKDWGSVGLPKKARRGAEFRIFGSVGRRTLTKEDIDTPPP